MTMQQTAGRLADLLHRAPVVHDAARAASELADLAAQAPATPGLAEMLALPRVAALITGIFGASPFLTVLMQQNPTRLVETLVAAPATRLEILAQRLATAIESASTQSEAMRSLRQFKAASALFLALGDIGGIFPGADVTKSIAQVADTAIAAAVRFLFKQAQMRGDWLDQAADAEMRSGYTVIAMGKHGANELNYSSDVDLIIFFDPAKVQLHDKHEPLTYFVRLTRDLVRLMQERTEDGYVFRTDLRLRPDPGATPIAISRDAALQYYENFGQNWERAAMIKARAVAGDLETGRDILNDLAPFIWRKYLDFAAIADIHAMKRQIHAVRGFDHIAIAGHNIKLGRGGIREIEFFAQTQQLIAGGRQKRLRIPTTIGALEALTERGWITADVRDDLTAAYIHLRTIEHRLQMLNDEQTQTLPDAPDDLARLAHFAGYLDIVRFSTALTKTLETVQRHYAQLFETSPELTTGGTNMVFAGESDDPATVIALGERGFSNPSAVIGLVRGWHHGRTPAVRSPRARELLTEVQPLLMDALAKTADPDAAILAFDRFLSDLPSGVQLFSLLKQKPSLLDLIAAIMGTAPRLARVLGRRRRVLDAVLDPGFFGALANRDMIHGIVAQELAEADDLQSALDRARAVAHEQTFLIGVRILTGSIGADRAGGAYALLADQMIEQLAARVKADIVRAHGTVPGGGAVVIAMGKLGGREMTATSDLDLILVYDFEPDTPTSQGLRPLSPVQYYTRFTQRLIAAFNAPTAEGALYEIDMRLRPSGQKGPVATQLSSFIEYQAHDAWTWEHMALTRARIVYGSPELTGKVEAAIYHTLTLPRDRAKIVTDVRDMRARIWAEKGTTDLWDLKQTRGGLVDLEFIAQFLQLVHANQHPDVLCQNTAAAFTACADASLIPRDAADQLLAAAKLLHNLTQILRLCLESPFDAANAPDGLKLLLAQAGEVPDFPTLEGHLKSTLAQVAVLFDRLVA
jgi:[glutamine synthetase] adenylyltransferase / [glutamine synthetase]-adenylyl-L-tyrosine phosphorylase